MCHLRHKLRIFLFRRKVMFHSQDIQVFCIFNHPMFYQICDVMMNMSIWDSVHFWIYLLNHNSLIHQTWPIDRYNQGQSFSGIFWTIWKTGAQFQVLFNLATCSNYSITSYVKIPVLHFFDEVNKRSLKMVNVNCWKWPDLAILSF